MREPISGVIPFLSVRILEVLDELNIHMVNPDAIRGMIRTWPETPFDAVAVLATLPA